MDPEERIERYARLAVEVGVNLQPGQVLRISAGPEHLAFVRAIARVAYENGAAYVETTYRDDHIRRARILYAAEETLEWSPPWSLALIDHMVEHGGAIVFVTGSSEPELLADLDQRRVARARPREVARRILDAENRRLVQWTIIGYPNPGWATSVFGEPDVERLWDAVVTATRLDEDDPVAAWTAHLGRLDRRAAALDARSFDAIRFRGPGTDLEIGLIPGHHWVAGADTTVTGIAHVANMPTEEVFTTPDRRRTRGTARSTMPLALGGTVVHGLELDFDHGEIVDVRATSGLEAVLAQLETDPGARRLGEVALVDGASRVRRTGLTFQNTLFDENAACHIAYGQGIHVSLPNGGELDDDELERLGYNDSTVHTDLMIGGPEVDVFGVALDGSETPIISDDRWVLD